MTEAQLQKKVINFCRENNILAYKVESQSTRGLPDLLLIKNKKIMFLELKHPSGSGKLAKIQEAIIINIKKEGIPVYVEHDFDRITSIILKTFNQK